jgi:hypothetical protein
MMILNAGEGARVSGTAIRWTIDRLGRHDQVTLRYTAKLRSDIGHSTRVLNTACVLTGSRVCSSATVGIVDRFPITGVMDTGEPPASSAVFVRPVKRAETTGPSAMATTAVTMTVIMTGLAAGAFAGRRFLGL